MSRNQRIALVVAAVLVAVLAFVVASPGGDDDDDSEQAAQTTTTDRGLDGDETTPTDGRGDPGRAARAGAPRGSRSRGGEVVGGPKTHHGRRRATGCGSS